MGCNQFHYPGTSFDGGTWTDSTLVRPEVVNGKTTGMEHESAHLTGNITIDPQTAQMLASALCQYISGCVSFSANEVAGVFKDCTNRPLTEGSQIATCLDIESLRENILLQISPDNILKFLTTMNGRPLKSNDQVVVPSDLDAVTNQMNTRLDNTIEQTEQKINDLSTSLTEKMDRELSKAVDKVSGELDSLVEGKVPTITAEHPAVTETASLPTTIIGERDQILGEPAIFFQMGDFLIPAYRKA